MFHQPFFTQFNYNTLLPSGPLLHCTETQLSHLKGLTRHVHVYVHLKLSIKPFRSKKPTCTSLNCAMYTVTEQPISYRNKDEPSSEKEPFLMFHQPIFTQFNNIILLHSDPMAPCTESQLSHLEGLTGHVHCALALEGLFIFLSPFVSNITTPF